MLEEWKRVAQFDLKPKLYKYTNPFTGISRYINRRSTTAKHYIFRLNSAVRKDHLGRFIVLQLHSSVSRNDENGRSWRGTVKADEHTWIQAATEVILNRDDAETMMVALQMALLELDRQEEEEEKERSAT